MAKISDKVVRELEPPASGNRIAYDDDLKGFGVRITASGARSFVLNYRASGRERRFTIGAPPSWTAAAARERAKELRRAVDRGEDPMAEREADRTAPTVADLAARYLIEHAPRKRAISVRDDKSMLEKLILPKLGRIKAEAIRRADIAALHRELSATAPIRANRVLALLSKMFSLAIEWEIRADNPCKGVAKNAEDRRERYLSTAELLRLTEALAAHKDQATANALRLLLLTGARRGEVLGATWSQFDLETGVWTKPASTTKQRKVHRVPLSAPAMTLLREMRTATKGAVLFPGRGGNSTQGDLKKGWATICTAAGLENLRVHDLRHSYASFLAGAGLSLPVIGALLGHATPTTTARYAHLADDPLRAATERVGALVNAGMRPSGDVVPMARARG
jgi:integrase